MQKIEPIHHRIAQACGQVGVGFRDHVHNVGHDDPTVHLHFFVSKHAQPFDERIASRNHRIATEQVHGVQAIRPPTIELLANEDRYQRVFVNAHVGFEDDDVDLVARVPHGLAQRVGFDIGPHDVGVPYVGANAGGHARHHLQVVARVVVHLHHPVHLVVLLHVMVHDIVLGEHELLLVQDENVAAHEVDHDHPVAFQVANVGGVVLVLHQDHRRKDDAVE